MKGSGRNLLLCIDLKSDAEIFGVIFDVFVDVGGAEAIFDAFVFRVVGFRVSGSVSVFAICTRIHLRGDSLLQVFDL